MERLSLSLESSHFGERSACALPLQVPAELSQASQPSRSALAGSPRPVLSDGWVTVGLIVTVTNRHSGRASCTA